MPDLYNEDVPATASNPSAQEAEVVKKLFRYISPEMTPWRARYLKTVAQCANFKELRQWGDGDAMLLKSLDVPAVPVDRINRGLDTISGIRANSNSKRTIAPREGGDKRIANVLDKVCDEVAYQGGFEEVSDETFESMRDYGVGIRKVGFDPTGNGGRGEVWAGFCNVEDVWWGKCRKKDLSDAPWFAHHQLMDWEDAMALSPDRASELKGMQTKAVEEWEKLKGGIKSTSGTRDYQTETSEGVTPDEYPHQVHVWEFWVKKRTLLQRIQSTEVQTLADPRQPDAPPVPLPVAKIRTEPSDYIPVENERVHSTFVQQSYVQYIVATGKEQTGGIILAQAEDYDHPFVGMVCERKKSGEPRGYIEIVIPHQQRINLAWAQKIAFNNKAIKTPLILKNAQGENVDQLTQASHFGSVLMLKPGTDVVSVNTSPNVNLEALEEGNSARADMDFAAAATEEALRGVSGSDVSGIKFSLQQHAATTPLNKWVKAEQFSDVTFWRKVLRLVCRYFKPVMIERILGEGKFKELMIGPIDPASGQPLEPPIEFPLDLSVVDYDVVVTDQAVTDFNRQQSFNAVEALNQSGIPFEPEYRIRNAPIKDTDAAVDAYHAARNDVLKYVMAENQMLVQKVAELEKVASKVEGKPNREKNQPQNARAGANASQAGQRSMVGGQMGMPG